MGHLREKYTKTYFTGLNPDGTRAHYGIEGNFNGTETTLRDFDIQIVRKINFHNANVLEIGFGRGESIKYVLEQGAASYVGVDFAAPAYEIAKEFIQINNLNNVDINCGDALEFLQNNGGKIKAPIDIVLMLDVLEHIPRHEVSELLNELKKHLSDKAILIINTPAYRFDNDIIANGIDERNYKDAIDNSDFIEETKGMHCNKYSISSLQEFMANHSYANLTEFHIYGWDKSGELQKGFESERIIPYAQLWNKAYKEGFPIKKDYIADILEFAYNVTSPVKLISSDKAMIEGIKIYGLPSVFENFYEDGSLDYLQKFLKNGSTVFDVGCYVGLSGLYFAKSVGKKGKVICFEPNKYNLLRIKKNFSENTEYLDNLCLYNFGLSDNNEVAELLLSDNIENGYASTSQLVKGGGTAIPKSELESMGFFKETVKLKTLDSFVEETGIIPDIIKVDIEGAELPFLKGSIKTLEKHKPVLFIELHNVFAACFVLQMLDKLNYEIHVLSEEWGNRAQVIAICNNPVPLGLSDKKNVEVLVQAYCSNKAKSYQDNLEAYAKSQELENQTNKGHIEELDSLLIEKDKIETEYNSLLIEKDRIETEYKDHLEEFENKYNSLLIEKNRFETGYNRLNNLLIIRAGKKFRSYISK